MARSQKQIEKDIRDQTARLRELLNELPPSRRVAIVRLLRRIGELYGELYEAIEVPQWPPLLARRPRRAAKRKPRRGD